MYFLTLKNTGLARMFHDGNEFMDNFSETDCANIVARSPGAIWNSDRIKKKYSCCIILARIFHEGGYYLQNNHLISCTY